MAAELPRFSGAVLTGGASRRMGRDKALVEVDGVPLVEIAAGALRSGGAAEVFAVGGDLAALSELGLVAVPDQFPGGGPLGGIVTALDAASEDVVVVLACDHLATGAPAVRSTVVALGDNDVAIPVVEGHPQTLHAAWRRSTRFCLRACFEAGRRSVHEALDGLSVVWLLDADPTWYRDADVPGDLPGTDVAGDTK